MSLTLKEIEQFRRGQLSIEKIRGKLKGCLYRGEPLETLNDTEFRAAVLRSFPHPFMKKTLGE